MIVDVQVGVFTLTPPVFRGTELLGNIRSLLDRARAAGVHVIFIQHDGQEAEHPLRTSGPGWPIHPDIAPRSGEPVIRKRFSDSFQETRLSDELRTRGIKRLVLAGIQTDYCVDTTCRRAFSLGYEVTLAGDAHSTWDNVALTAAQIIAHHNAVLGNGFARVLSADAIRFD